MPRHDPDSLIVSDHLVVLLAVVATQLVTSAASGAGPGVRGTTVDEGDGPPFGRLPTLVDDAPEDVVNRLALCRVPCVHRDEAGSVHLGVEPDGTPLAPPAAYVLQAEAGPDGRLGTIDVPRNGYYLAVEYTTVDVEGRAITTAGYLEEVERRVFHDEEGAPYPVTTYTVGDYRDELGLTYLGGGMRIGDVLVSIPGADLPPATRFVTGRALSDGVIWRQVSSVGNTSREALLLHMRAKNIPDGAQVTVLVRGCGQVQHRRVLTRPGTYRFDVTVMDPRRKFGDEVVLQTVVSSPGFTSTGLLYSWEPKDEWSWRCPTRGGPPRAAPPRS